jgi:putative transposase
MSSLAECTDLEITKSKSIRLSPTPSQKATYSYWVDSARFTYNWAMDILRDCNGTAGSWIDLKKIYTSLQPEWVRDCPFQVKGNAIKEAYHAYFAGIKKAKQIGKPANFSFRSRKTPMQSCYIPKTAVKPEGIYPRVSGKGLHYRESLPKTILDSRLVYQYGEWFLSVPHKVKTRVAENQGRIVSLDPGIRTFQTFYSETSAGWIGYDDFGRIKRLCYWLDNLISRTTKQMNAKRKRAMKKAQSRIRKKIKNVVKELHNKTARFLVDNFDVILLPTFETKAMASRLGVLMSKTVRAMLTWSHYKFKVHLKNKALETGKTVIDVNESYTSKTVSWNGENVNVGGSRVIRSGGITLDRDLNGARNIFIRSLGDSPTLMRMQGAC